MCGNSQHINAMRKGGKESMDDKKQINVSIDVSCGQLCTLRRHTNYTFTLIAKSAPELHSIPINSVELSLIYKEENPFTQALLHRSWFRCNTDIHYINGTLAKCPVKNDFKIVNVFNIDSEFFGDFRRNAKLGVIVSFDTEYNLCEKEVNAIFDNTESKKPAVKKQLKH